MGAQSETANDDEVRQPVSEVLRGLEACAEPGDTAIEAFLLVKVLTSDGSPIWAYRTTNRLNREELLGALTVHVAVLTKELRDEWDDDPPRSHAAFGAFLAS